MAKEEIKNNFEEEKEAFLSEIKKEAEKIIGAAKDEAKTIIETAQNSVPTTKSTVSDAVMAEIKKNEEYVEVKLFKDSEKYKDDVYVAVGDQNCVIKRGVPVKIKRKFLLAINQSTDQDLRTTQLIERETQK